MLHKWIGIVFGIWIFLMGVTGALIAFHAELRTALAPSLFRTGDCGAVPRFDLMEAAVRAAYPEYKLRRIERENRYCDESYRFIVGRHDATSTTYGPLADTEVFVDPRDGRILGSEPWLGVIQTAYQLHGFLLSGRVGRTVLGFLGLILLVNVICGLVVWWPAKSKVPLRRRLAASLKVRWNSRPRMLLRDLHKVAGVCTILVFGLILITGLSLTFPEPTQRFLRLFADAPASEASSGASPARGRAVLSDLHAGMARITRMQQGSPGQQPPERVGAQQIYDTMQRTLPGNVPIRIYFPSGAMGGFFFYISQRPERDDYSTTFTAYLNPFDATVFYRSDHHREHAFQWWVTWSLFAHSGRFFGLPGRIVALLMGLILAGLVVTGFYVWLAKSSATVRTEPVGSATSPT